MDLTKKDIIRSKMEMKIRGEQEKEKRNKISAEFHFRSEAAKKIKKILNLNDPKLDEIFVIKYKRGPLDSSSNKCLITERIAKIASLGVNCRGITPNVGKAFLALKMDGEKYDYDINGLHKIEICGEEEILKDYEEDEKKNLMASIILAGDREDEPTEELGHIVFHTSENIENDNPVDVEMPLRQALLIEGYKEFVPKSSYGKEEKTSKSNVTVESIKKALRDAFEKDLFEKQVHFH